MRGKYSPTVKAAYRADQEWWMNYAYTEKHTREREYVQYDPEGYDQYGYDAGDTDRAGNQEHVYYVNDLADDGLDGDCNYAYEDAEGEWSFNGTKPVKVQ